MPLPDKPAVKNRGFWYFCLCVSAHPPEAIPYLGNDVLVEADAELACDAREVLPSIPVPVLLVCGDRDPIFPKEVYEETARLIPDCTLIQYEGTNGIRTAASPRVPRDVLTFIHRKAPSAT